MPAPKLHGWRTYEPSTTEQQELLRRFTSAYKRVAPMGGNGSVTVLETALERTVGMSKPQRMEQVDGTIWALGARFRSHPGDPANVRILFPYALPPAGLPELTRDIAIYMQGRAVEQDVEIVLQNLEAVFLHTDKDRLTEDAVLPEEPGFD